MSLASLLAASLWAEDKSSTQPRDNNNSQQEMSRTLVVVRTSQLIGQEVKNPQGQTLGKIYDLVLTSDRSQVAYIALSSGGILGMGDDLYAVPWSSLQVSSDKQSTKGMTEGNKQADPQNAVGARTYILNISKARLEKQNGFKQDRWPKAGNLHWDSTSSSELQATDTKEADSDRTTEQNRQVSLTSQELDTHLVSKLTGREVQNYEGEKIGKVEEFVIARQHAEMQSNSHDSASLQNKGSLQAKDHMFISEGKMLYATIALGGFLGFGEEYALVPANKVSFMTQRDHALLLADKTKLQAVAFKANKWPDLSSPAYAKEVYDSFDASDYWTVLGYRSPLSQTAEPVKGKAVMSGEMPTCCVEMKAKCQKMWDDLKAEDAALTKRVTEMNSASADKKMTLMTALITRMVEQRASTNARMEKMQDDMMQHMMTCPMMMGMKDMAKKPMVAPSEHPK
jgi:sporulation protein YlmC with PRC-barrel domain